MVIKKRLELMDWVYDNVPKDQNYSDVSLFVYHAIRTNVDRPSFGESWADFLNNLNLAELINSAKDELKRNDGLVKT